MFQWLHSGTCSRVTHDSMYTALVIFFLKILFVGHIFKLTLYYAVQKLCQSTPPTVYKCINEYVLHWTLLKRSILRIKTCSVKTNQQLFYIIYFKEFIHLMETFQCLQIHSVNARRNYSNHSLSVFYLTEHLALF